MRPEIARLQADMRGFDYVAEPSIVTAVHLARAMEKPLLVEGDAGVGKTEIAKVMAGVMETELIRLQCYEGLDVNTALYEWNYRKQLLRLRIAAEEGGGRAGGSAAGESMAGRAPEVTGESMARRDTGGAAPAPDHLEDIIFGRSYLLERPLLRAITAADRAPVLLIDEIDRADDGFEAFLLEVLSDFQVTIPELGTIRATHRPFVVLTSNRTREIGDALRRRCLYLYIEHPTFEKEVEIVRAKVPGISERLAGEITRFVQELRGRRLMRPPGVAETLDWARALITLHRDRLDAETASETLGCLVKDRHDMRRVDGGEVVALDAPRSRPDGT
ncbi:MAG: MoxR family ATPase [Gemmatimonadota bacterium]|nr:MoxR family ATPase [Gemmatimonadota bacterium]MDE2870833.1 MoxR family ATPase [Gemmatimonadota bacterium]